MKNTSTHPCLSCGACCSFFRVSFYWREAEPGGPWQVPASLAVENDSIRKSMRGTEVHHRPKCAALKGRIGRDGHCSIYESRPSPCRDFQASFSDGKRNIKCDEARAAHGLKPLTRADYPKDLTCNDGRADARISVDI